MTIDIQYFNSEPDWETKNFVSEKLNKLQLRYGNIMGVKVYMKSENNNKNKNKLVEFKLGLPEKTLFSEARGESFHIAAKEALAGIISQLKKYRTVRAPTTL